MPYALTAPAHHRAGALRTTGRRLCRAFALLACALPLLATAQTRDEDDRLATRVDAALIGHGAHGIHVEVRGGEVMLSGFVDSQAEGASALEAAMKGS